MDMGGSPDFPPSLPLFLSSPLSLSLSSFECVGGGEWNGWMDSKVVKVELVPVYGGMVGRLACVVKMRMRQTCSIFGSCSWGTRVKVHDSRLRLLCGLEPIQASVFSYSVCSCFPRTGFDGGRGNEDWDRN